MGKRLACPRCGAQNEYDVPANEVTAAHQQIPCRSCGHRFGYGFKPEYVTEAEPVVRDARSVPAPYDSATEVAGARERLSRHVMEHLQYRDRDRDVLLLQLVDNADHVDGQLAALKRVLDVLVKRVGPKP